MDSDKIKINIDIKNGKILNNKKDIEILLKYIKINKKKEITKLDKCINIIKLNLLIEEKKLEQLLNKIKYLESPELDCKICYQNKVNITLIPCGHVFCSSCITNQNLCPYCRRDIQNKQPLFFY